MSLALLTRGYICLGKSSDLTGIVCGTGPDLVDVKAMAPGIEHGRQIGEVHSEAPQISGGVPGPSPEGAGPGPAIDRGAVSPRSVPSIIDADGRRPAPIIRRGDGEED
jgi:hypothetical protein